MKQGNHLISYKGRMRRHTGGGQSDDIQVICSFNFSTGQQPLRRPHIAGLHQRPLTPSDTLYTLATKLSNLDISDEVYNFEIPHTIAGVERVTSMKIPGHS